MKRILFLEDDPMIARMLSGDLSAQGYAVSWHSTVREARLALGAERFDLVILDVNLPDGTSYDLCRELCAENPGLPVLFLTSRADEDSAIRGLSVGATDYLRKPFGRSELLLRIRRSLQGIRGEHRLGNLSLNLDERRVKVGGEPVALTPREFEILAVLARNLGQAVSREKILEATDPEGEAVEESISTHISRLRTKLRKAGLEGLRLVTLYGDGYRLEKGNP